MYFWSFFTHYLLQSGPGTIELLEGYLIVHELVQENEVYLFVESLLGDELETLSIFCPCLPYEAKIDKGAEVLGYLVSGLFRSYPEVTP